MRIPYGYSIEDGRAVINESETSKLKRFFEGYLSGMSMAAAAKEAGLPCTPPTYPHLFSKKEYTGTDFYPTIITPEEQEELVSEYERRKSKSPRCGMKQPPKAVPVYTQFRFRDTSPVNDENPAEYAAALYKNISPIQPSTNPDTPVRTVKH